jgi:hypothetical protein
VIFWHFLGAFANFRKAPVTCVMPVLPSVRPTIRTGRISMKLIFMTFMKTWRGNPSFVKVVQKYRTPRMKA